MGDSREHLFYHLHFTGGPKYKETKKRHDFSEKVVVGGSIKVPRKCQKWKNQNLSVCLSKST